MDFICGHLAISPTAATASIQNGSAETGAMALRWHCDNISGGEIDMADLVDIALPSQAQAAAEGMGLTVQRSVTSGAWVRRLPRDEAEIAVECLRDFGFSARIVDNASESERLPEGKTTQAASG
jgi:hypothetical protein